MQDKQVLVLCSDQKSKTQSMKDIFGMFFDVVISAVENGGSAVFFYAHFMDAPVNTKDEAVGVCDIKDGKLGGAKQKCTI